MRKQAPVVEWYLAESDADWEQRCGQPMPNLVPAGGRRLQLNRSFWSVVALLLLLVSTGSWWWRADQAALPQPVADVTASAQPALGEIVPGRASVAAFVTDGQATLSREQHLAQEGISLSAAGHPTELDAQIAIGVRTVEVWGEQAVAHVVTRAEGGAPAYRQTRFYRRTAKGWQPTAPNAALWGTARSLETPSFVYQFRQNDAQAVVAVLPQMDTLYRSMRRNVGLPLISATEKLVIEVSVTQPLGKAALWLQVSDRFIVPSPALYVAPVELTDAELLAQSIALLLLDAVIAQAGEQYALGSTWQPMLRGVRLWQVWDLDLPLAAWREEVVRWLYVDLPTASPGQSDLLPNHYPKLCADHKLWMPSPLQIDIPFVCAERESEYIDLLPWSGRGPPMRLDQLAVPVLLDEELIQSSAAGQVIYPGRVVVLATLIEYAVATYGHERLSTLMAGMGHYDTWDTLLPAVYGVSPAEFEAGWQVYLASQYGVGRPSH
jgi:hypothetical protein